MKKFCLILILLFALCGCEGQTAETADIAGTAQTTAQTVEGTAAVDHVLYGEGWTYLSEVDFTEYSDRLDEKQNEDLALYLPILKNEQQFVWQRGWIGEAVVATMSDVYNSFWGDFEDAPCDLMVNGFAMLDITGDGANELVLYLNDIGGHYIVLHRENDSVYGIDFPIRTFFLMKNGVYVGSGGAATHWYYQLRFVNGRFVEIELGSIDEHLNENAELDGGKYTINGEEVSKTEFEEWQKTIYADDVKYIMLKY